MKIEQGSIVAAEGEHILITGPINGTVTTADGEVVDVTPAAIVVRDPEHAQAVAHAIGEYWADPNTPPHPDHIEVGDDGQVRVKEFVHDPEQSKKNMKAALKNAAKED